MWSAELRYAMQLEIVHDEQVARPERSGLVTDLKLPNVVGKTVGFAVVGLGQLALEQIMPAFARSLLARPTALVSRHPDWSAPRKVIRMV